MRPKNNAQITSDQRHKKAFEKSKTEFFFSLKTENGQLKMALSDGENFTKRFKFVNISTFWLKIHQELSFYGKK